MIPTLTLWTRPGYRNIIIRYGRRSRNEPIFAGVAPETLHILVLRMDKEAAIMDSAPKGDTTRRPMPGRLWGMRMSLGHLLNAVTPFT